MCRWLAYSGGDIPLAELIINTRHSLIDQLTDAARCVVCEPLSDLRDLWEPIPEASFITIEGGRVESRSFQPITD